MKIAILTQPLGHNYGGILQNYALQRVLIKLGHFPETLEKDYLQYISIFRLFFELPKRIFTKYILKKRDFIFSEKKYNEIATTNKKLFPFVIKYINHTYLHDFSSIVGLEYDAIIVGSDQVWRSKYNRNYISKMFLSFIPESSNIKRIAYAASFGASEWEYNEEQTSTCSKLIQRFDAVSTREIDGLVLCKKYLNRNDVISVLDPTLLLTKEDYLKLCEDIPKCDNNLLFAYILDIDSEIRLKLDELANLKGLKLKLVYADENCTLSVEEWIAMYRDAKMVITDSFHGTIFSIIFNKEFYSICNVSRGNSRFTSLLSQFNLQDRLFNDAKSINLSSNQIGWDIVEETKFSLQNKSIKFLTDKLNSNA